MFSMHRTVYSSVNLIRCTTVYGGQLLLCRQPVAIAKAGCSQAVVTATQSTLQLASTDCDNQ